VEVNEVGYEQFGIDKSFVERVKLKMKNPQLNQRVQMILHGVSKSDLQNRTKLSRMLNQIAKVLGEKPSERLSENIISFVVAQKIDPNNKFHLIKLWGIFH
jgi:hypothetical protein